MASTIVLRARGREILDSRGNPTVEAEVELAGGTVARAAAPSGASTGKREAVELRDKDARYGGRGARRAAANIGGELAQAILGQDAAEQQNIDQRLCAADGTDDKSRLGANAILALSLACLKAAAKARGQQLFAAAGEGKTLPVPLMNILNGGAHADNALDVQEFMIVPHGFDNFEDALRAGCEVFFALRDELRARGLNTAVGDEGGYAPNVAGAESALELIQTAIARAGYAAGAQIGIALDVAASELWQDGQYALPADGISGDAAALVDKLARWASAHPIVSIEDGCGEDDWEGWKLLGQRLGQRVQLVGDDVFATNPAILRAGIDAGVANALLVKPNQIGTVSETAQAARMAQMAGYATIMSHRSGETEYADIADLAVGMGCAQIKTGAPCRGERTAKYNRLLRIADALGAEARFAGNVFAA